MVSVNRVERVVIFLFALNLYGIVMGGDDLKDDNIDRGSRSDRGGLWFGPRLGKRSLHLVNDDNRQTFLRLLEAADALKYYYDQLSYEPQSDEEMKVTKKVIFTPKLGRAVNSYESVDFTPRLGRRFADDRVTPSDQDNYRPEVEQMDRNKYFSPRLGRTMNFSPRLGRELSYGFVGLILSISNAQILFATDVEEFRNLAKKLVPVNIADKLVEIVSQNKYNHESKEYQFDDDSKEDDAYYYEEYYYEDNDAKYQSKPTLRQEVNAPDPGLMHSGLPKAITSADIQRPKPIEVNLDGLVERVRDKLLDEFHKNPTELQKLLGPQSVIANFKNESNHNENIKKLKFLRDRHDEKHNQQSRPRQKISKHQLINIERKDSRYRPQLRISIPQSSNIERNIAQGQAYEEDDLPSRYRPGLAISIPLTSNIERKDLQGQINEKTDLISRYRPRPAISRPLTRNIERKDTQDQVNEANDHTSQNRPRPGISRPLSSNVKTENTHRQVNEEDDHLSRYRPGPEFSKPLTSNIELKLAQGQVNEEDDHPLQYRPGPRISKPLSSNVGLKVAKGQVNEEDDHSSQYRPGPGISRLLSSNIEKKDDQGQAYEEKDLPSRYRPGQRISRPQSSNKEIKDAKALALMDDDLPEVDAEGNVRIPKDQRQTQKPDFIFQEFNLNGKNDEKDTYEDYVMPKKEENIFVSEEVETTTKQTSALRWGQPSKLTQKVDIFNYKLQNGIRVSSQASKQINPKVSVISSIFDDSNETTTEPDLKARTENLWFDYKDEPVAKVLQKNAQASKGDMKPIKLGTMIPTRETYKMTSPNYYGQLPTVAEKYDFEEPIPEKDREREEFKPIVNPLANINGKIKV